MFNPFPFTKRFLPINRAFTSWYFVLPINQRSLSLSVAGHAIILSITTQITSLSSRNVTFLNPSTSDLSMNISRLPMITTHPSKSLRCGMLVKRPPLHIPVRFGYVRSNLWHVTPLRR